MAWKMCCRTRLLQGDHAYMILNQIFGKQHTHNMTFSRKGGNAYETSENQIDGNLGVLMGTSELFLQSHQGEVYLLPALPDKMETGSVTGLRARGGFEVDIVWDNNELQTAQIHSLVGNTCRVRSAWPIAVTDGGLGVSVQTPGADLYEFATEAGHTYTLSVYSCTSPITSDFNGDCQVTLPDFAILAGEWLDNGGADYDLTDLLHLAIDWLTCNRDPLSECWQ
jgi:alpha-L-fucosidase 2